ncbi:MAG: DUF3486 family protein [Lamprocystis purpurea]|jgi:hypothetical protein|uniref:phage protein Gp27 family protein n=1 Tax=Lamprocystis purpurea TaxID=61598 RepID=UPI00036EE6E5|nr:phage protein Gp27 family protein [Lamprocystis purpurea]MBV5274021.1 DUF3486 family protein [Lamprocystis purpurea]
MPPVSWYDRLPADFRLDFCKEAAARGWGDMVGLSAWLTERGYSIGKSAVGETVKQLRDEYDDTMREMRAMAELARQITEQDSDPTAALNDLAGRLMTDQLVRAAKELRAAEDLDISDRIKLLQKLAMPITQSQRAAVYARRWSQEQRREAEAAVREAALAAGLDDATAERVASGVKIYLPDNGRRGAGGG